MIRLAVSVEGETEEEFVNQSLAPHLRRRDIYVQPVLIGPARRRVRGGGNVSIDRLASEMRQLRWSFDAVTSLVDFYGFKDKGSRLPGDLLQVICNRIGQLDERSVFPYVQLHEFEGLLFSERGSLRPDTPGRSGRRAQVDSLRVRHPGGLSERSVL